MGSRTMAWDRLGDYLHQTKIIGSIASTLYWDQNTRMPSGGAAWRGEQLALLAIQLHSRQSSREYADLIQEARVEWSHSGLSTTELAARGRNLDLLEQDLGRQQALDPTLVAALATAKADGYNNWQQARADSDFGLFAPSLRSMIGLRQEQARQLAEPRSCWETLAQPFEPDLTLKRLQELFAPLRQRLPELLQRAGGQARERELSWDLSEPAQQHLCDRLLTSWGQDASITCVARSPHPFSITLGPSDYRITTRVVPGQPLSCFLATAHEWGHSLYEQGLPDQKHQWFAWPLGQATSMAVHESQSLFWENRVARSQPFAQQWWPDFEAAGAPLPSADALWSAMNPLAPGLNRVEADELSYGLHIVMRYELELALLEQGLPVAELPERWNHRFAELLGQPPDSDSNGCLQDIHWAEGLFGYFPSYALGHLISAQLSEAMERDLGSLPELIASGQEQQLRQWLAARVWPLGRSVNGEQLVQQVSGEPLSAAPFLRYLEEKVERLLSVEPG